MALAGDRDRERAADDLRRHYVAGRLSDDELDHRLGLALRARTRGDVRRATASLPPWWAELDEVVPALRTGVERARHAAVVAVLGLVWLMVSAATSVAFVAWVAVHGASGVGLVAFPLVWLALSGLLYRRAVVSRRRLARPYPRDRIPRSTH